MLVLQIAQASMVIAGIILITIGHRHRLPEYKSFYGGKFWSRGAFNPLSPFGLNKHRDKWTARGFQIHRIGILLFAMGIISGASDILIRWLG